MLKLVGNGQWPTVTSSTVFKSNSPVFSIHNFFAVAHCCRQFLTASQIMVYFYMFQIYTCTMWLNVQNLE